MLNISDMRLGDYIRYNSTSCTCPATDDRTFPDMTIEEGQHSNARWLLDYDYYAEPLLFIVTSICATHDRVYPRPIVTALAVPRSTSKCSYPVLGVHISFPTACFTKITDRNELTMLALRGYDFSKFSHLDSFK